MVLLLKKSNCFLYTLLVVQLYYFITSDLLETLHHWNYLRFDVPNYFLTRADDIKLENAVFTGLEISEDFIFLSVPRLRDGVPATLVYLPRYYSKKVNPILHAYPSWDFHLFGFGRANCSGLISVYRIRQDKCNRLWVLDSGVSDSLNKFEKICPPKILIFNLKNHQVEFSINVPDKVIKTNSLLTNFVIDDNANSCYNIHLYISDTAEPAPMATFAKKFLIKNIGGENVFNTDQRGFNLEIHSGRTLAIRGDKTVESLVQSMSAMTHSYTIQIVISADGKLMSPMLLVLKETHGFFGPNVQKNLYRPTNIYITASKSGKQTSEHVKNWTNEVYFPNVGNQSALILDSWRGQCDRTLISQKPANKNFTLLTIPEGATKYIQPLDVFTFRQWKDFVRKFSDEIQMNEYNLTLYNRNVIIKLQSLTHNQFSAPIYHNMFKYAWFKSGYDVEKPGNFTTPADFSFKRIERLSCDICGKPAFMKCAYCNKTLCFDHFYTEHHFH